MASFPGMTVDTPQQAQPTKPSWELPQLIKMKDLRQDPFSQNFKYDPNRFDQSQVYNPNPSGGAMSGDALEKLRRRQDLQNLYLRSEEAQSSGRSPAQDEMDYRSRLEKDMLPFQMEDSAAEMRSKGYQDDVFNPFKNNVLKDLAQSSVASSKNAARRGLQGSGIEKGQQAGLVANASTNIAKGRQDIASAAEESAKEIENSQVQNGIQLRNMQQGMFNNIYNSALQSYQARNSGMLGQVKSVLKFGGAMAGAPLGGAGMAAGYKAGEGLGSGLGSFF